MATTTFEKPMGTEVETLKSDKQSKSDNTLTTSNKTVVGAINELNSKIITLQGYNYSIVKNFKNLANGASITSNTFTVPTTGTYRVHFTIAHIGANSITSAGAYWYISLRKSLDDSVIGQAGGATRSGMSIASVKAWDSEISVDGVYGLQTGVTYYAMFTNNTGIATDANYDSSVGLSATLISMS